MNMDHALAAWLENPENYPEPTSSVEVIQTHISVLFLTDHFVYKWKKPAHFTFLDFTTLEKRKHYCEEELRLNRRLCPGVYLEVRAIRRTAAGKYSFTEGEAVDYCVMMKRLPGERLMSLCLERGDPGLEEATRAIAGIIARLHHQPGVSEAVKEAGSPEHLAAKITGNFAETYQPGLFDPSLYDAVRAGFQYRIPALLEWLRKRAAAGKIVEGHGDLHAGNIFLTDPPTVFDCIEFAPEFRCGDAAVENAFLMMDLVFRGRRDLANVYEESYIGITGDREQKEYLPVLIAYQAMVRAKVAALAAADGDLAADQRARQEQAANRYLELAAASLLESAPRLPVILICGLPGSGKSYLSRLMARRFGWIHLSSDPIRKELAGIEFSQALPPECYTEGFSQKTYGEMKDRARAARLPVLADANFPRVQVRANFVEGIAKPVFLIWITCDEETTRERLERRARSPGEVSDAGFEVYRMLRERFEAPQDSENIPCLAIDGTAGAEKAVPAILAWLLHGVME